MQCSGVAAIFYTVALEHRSTAWQRRHASVSRYEQEAELKDIRAAFPEYAAMHSHVLQDMLARLDKTYQAFFHRRQRGDKADFPRFKGRTRFRSFTFKEFGNGATLDNGFLLLAKIGRISVHSASIQRPFSVHWSRQLVAAIGRGNWRERPRRSRSHVRPTAGA